jgi:hypothetical protein
LVPSYFEYLLAGGRNVSNDPHPILIEDSLYHTGLIRVQVPLDVFLGDTFQMM